MLKSGLELSARAFSLAVVLLVFSDLNKRILFVLVAVGGAYRSLIRGWG